MRKKQSKLSDQIRAVVKSCGISRYQICKDAGIDQGAFSRFMAGADITTRTVDRLAEYLGLEIIVAGKKKGRGE